MPLTEIWLDGTFLRPLVKHFVVFKRSSFPNIFSWTSFGAACMMELLVNKFRAFSSLSSTGKPSSHVNTLPYILELIAVMERVLAFCYTGSARVLVKDLMQPMWTTLSLKAFTTPILHPDIIQAFFGTSFQLGKNQWPVTAANTAAMASQRALLLTYSEYLADVSSVSSSYLLQFSALMPA